MSNLDDAEVISVVLKVSTNSLYIGSYSGVQKWLYERVKSLRDDHKLTFKAIADRLTAFGVRTARDKVLAEEHVFSIYKKGTRRQERLDAPASVEVCDLSWG